MINIDRAQFHLFHSPDEVPYASFEVSGHRETVAVRSRRFRSYVRATFGQGSYPLTERDLDSATEALADEAVILGPELVVNRRIARHGKWIEVDLGDPSWRAVRITEDGWEIVERPGALFVRNELTRALPEPVGPGSIEQLGLLMPNLSEDGLIGVAGFLMGLFNPAGTYPILCVTGEQGVGKSTLVAIIRGLSDPGDPVSTPIPKDELALGVHASQQHLLVFDNISVIKDPMSDALCRLASGTGQVNRKYYTNSDIVPMRYRNPVAITSLGNPIVQPDLLDRAISIEVERLPQDRARTDAQVELLLAIRGPRIIGGIFTAVSAALRNHYATKTGAKSRLADHELFVSAGETAFGWEPGTYADFLVRNRSAAQLEVVDNSPVAQAVLRLVKDEPWAWTGSMTELLYEVHRLSGNRPAFRSGVPDSTNKLAYEMKKIKPVLRLAGIEWEHEPRSADRTRTRRLTVFRSSDVAALEAITGKGDGSSDDLYEPDDLDKPDDLIAKQDSTSTSDSDTSPTKGGEMNLDEDWWGTDTEDATEETSDDWEAA